MSKIKILFIGNCELGSNALSLFKGFKNNGLETEAIDTSKFEQIGRFSIRRVIQKVFPTKYALFISLILQIIIKLRLRHFTPNLVFVFKGSFVNKKTLESLSFLKVHYHPDDSSNPVNRTSIFQDAEKEYDIHFTSKKYNISEISRRVNKPVYFFWYAYDPDWHFVNPRLDFSNSKYLIGFIGNFRRDRSDLISQISQIFGKSFAVAGRRWNKLSGLNTQSVLIDGAFGPSFSKFICDAPIQLGLLNSENRDSHTARTFEVPAAGGLLIAEDTADHREIFSSEKNVLFFKSRQELFEKISWAHANPQLAKVIAQNGHKLITRNENTWGDRAFFIIEKCLN